ncbi:MAG: bifunctional UDP-N-acetylglucosamine diphosphorylase/glucosamine-1-phosphate N-acetyltransferase GlmU, partial [Acidimicrobiia bacterium]|nr:bifunctional UDP-N-acetylglucosamine diphosphorylase/glucosamine-1-phosphate N-acetyltransferase GlmU [Acidimicrobiia bacterium]
LADGTDVLVLAGDTPLIDGATLQALIDAHRHGEAAVSLLSTVIDDPHGYGRIVRSDGQVTGVVEQADASSDELAIDEVNAGMYVFDAATMRADLESVSPDNAQGEYYLPDLVAVAAKRGDRLVALPAPADRVAGVNTHLHLAAAARTLRARIAERWMEAGVRLIDPSSTYIDADVELARGVVIYPGVYLEAGTRVEAGAVVGPDVFASGSVIGADSRVWYSVLRQAEVGPDCQVGPYASLRPGTVLGRGAKLGTFVETKNTVVGEGTKVPHLSYMGDATIGAGSNIGAGSITCNYDGFGKYETVIGDGVFIGSDTMLVAPVTIGDGAMTAAGSAITHDVEPGALGVARGRQRNVPGFVQRLADRYRARGSEDRE